MDIREITYFLAIAETGFLTKAARRLFVTQPTLSHFLSTLEKDLGTELFYRNNTAGLELTSAGKVYYEGALKIRDIYNSTVQQIGDLANPASQSIRCGISASAQFMRKLIKCQSVLEERYPNALICPISATTSDIHRRVLSGTLEFGFSAYHVQEADLTYIPVLTSEVDLVVSPEHHIARYSYMNPGHESERISLSVAKNVPFALISENATLRQVEEEYFRLNNFHPIIDSTYAYHSILKEYMEQGKFAGFCPRYQHYDKMVRIALDPPMYYKIGLYYRSDARLSSPAKYLIELLSDTDLNYDL